MNVAEVREWVTFAFSVAAVGAQAPPSEDLAAACDKMRLKLVTASEEDFGGAPERGNAERQVREQCPR